jgi:hypothetical protein
MGMFVRAAKQRAHQAFRAVHLVSPRGFFSVLRISCMLPVAITDTHLLRAPVWGDLGGARAASGSPA